MHLTRHEEQQSPEGVVERVAELAMRLGRKLLADYTSSRSRHDFTHQQQMTCLILRAYLKTTYGACWKCMAEAMRPKIRNP
jgi:hypothetical protein